MRLLDMIRAEPSLAILTLVIGGLAAVMLYIVLASITF